MIERIEKKKVIAVAVLENTADALRLADALLAGGLDIIEVTFRTPAAAECIQKLRAAQPGMLVGAGTLLTPEQVQRARDAGAEFGVSAGLNEAVVTKANALGMPFAPGVMTPSDIERGLGLGCKLMKFFPAEIAGGVKALKAFAGPYGHTGVKFIPLGGVNAGNMRDYLALPNVAAVGGTWIVERKLIAEKQWATITKLTAEALQLSTGL